VSTYSQKQADSTLDDVSTYNQKQADSSLDAVSTHNKKEKTKFQIWLEQMEEEEEEDIEYY
jgi:hypothetical protein